MEYVTCVQSTLSSSLRISLSHFHDFRSFVHSLFLSCALTYNSIIRYLLLLNLLCELSMCVNVVMIPLFQFSFRWKLVLYYGMLNTQVCTRYFSFVIRKEKWTLKISYTPRWHGVPLYDSLIKGALYFLAKVFPRTLSTNSSRINLFRNRNWTLRGHRNRQLASFYLYKLHTRSILCSEQYANCY